MTSANEAKKAKISSRIEHLKRHIEEVHNQKEALNERLCANNESIGRVQAEINAACGDSNKPGKGERERERERERLSSKIVRASI